MRSFAESCFPNITVDKEPGGATWYVSIGTPLSCGKTSATGLSREQADRVAYILRIAMQESVESAQHRMRHCLGL